MPNFKQRIAQRLISLGRRLSGSPPEPPEWETQTFFRSKFEAPPPAWMGNLSLMADVAMMGFHISETVDRIQLSYSLGTLIIRTLGQRFTPDEVLRLNRYRIVGVQWLFEEAGEVYDRGRWVDYCKDEAA